MGRCVQTFDCCWVQRHVSSSSPNHTGTVVWLFHYCTAWHQWSTCGSKHLTHSCVTDHRSIILSSFIINLSSICLFFFFFFACLVSSLFFFIISVSWCRWWCFYSAGRSWTSCQLGTLKNSSWLMLCILFMNNVHLNPRNDNNLKIKIYWLEDLGNC